MERLRDRPHKREAEKYFASPGKLALSKAHPEPLSTTLRVNSVEGLKGVQSDWFSVCSGFPNSLNL